MATNPAEHTVIIGAGQAGIQVADSLRTEGYTGYITILNDEAAFPYQRPPLSKAVERRAPSGTTGILVCLRSRAGKSSSSKA